MSLVTLNELLADPSLNLPKHRRNVSEGGSNLKWLKDHIEEKNTISPELRVLLDTPIQNLVKG
jgi:hypothetical protein